jgi:phosphatidylserine/phosphatidylglycerophosphate/cardiolipin synthase-like enzyme
MTELLEAVADRDEDAETKRTLRVAAALYEAAEQGVRQRDLVEATGYTRETIRRHIEDEKIRRGLISPTKRYLAAQKRADRS